MRPRYIAAVSRFLPTAWAAILLHYQRGTARSQVAAVPYLAVLVSVFRSALGRRVPAFTQAAHPACPIRQPRSIISDPEWSSVPPLCFRHCSIMCGWWIGTIWQDFFAGRRRSCFLSICLGLHLGHAPSNCSSS
ncbi:hypothetical protein NDU88_005318 [Pleurodeles waltl]|uniref:Secreted protein n=1 Tax=Pleurodeles waltl TaxID=8319 RepID=A0AAV7UHP2_PLEWA|nr:hypothetical protein NDU88_005318 [Pleurodeles waltl]